MVLLYKCDWPLFNILDVLYIYFNVLSVDCSCIRVLFYHDGGFWFGRYVVFDRFVTIHFSMYCDIIVLSLS